MEYTKVAVLVSGGNPYCKRGIDVAVDGRVRGLNQVSKYRIDVFYIQIIYPWFLTKMFGKRNENKLFPENDNINGSQVFFFWVKWSLFRYVFCQKWNMISSMLRRRDVNKIVERLKVYDVISAHSYEAANIGFEIKRKYNIPYMVTWHGSDVHSVPFRGRVLFRREKSIMEYASANGYVSRALLNISNKITENCSKIVLYNGIGDCFVKYNDHIRKKLREKYSVDTRNVVGFVGSLVRVKNVLLVPKIFSLISQQVPNTILWIIGDGPLRGSLEKLTDGMSVKFWGSVSVSRMPELMNCMDCLLLPSVNEGLGMVSIEAISCGCHVVGSRVGGIPEVISEEYTVPLSDSFFERDMANLVVRCLTDLKDIPQVLNKEINWIETAKKEKLIIEKMVV